MEETIKTAQNQNTITSDWKEWRTKWFYMTVAFWLIHCFFIYVQNERESTLYFQNELPSGTYIVQGLGLFMSYYYGMLWEFLRSKLKRKKFDKEGHIASALIISILLFLMGLFYIISQPESLPRRYY